MVSENVLLIPSAKNFGLVLIAETITLPGGPTLAEIMYEILKST